MNYYLLIALFQKVPGKVQKGLTQGDWPEGEAIFQQKNTPYPFCGLAQ
jgi:hypothetical protein